MSLFGSLSTGVAGLAAQGQSMSVISDNLANVNTVGYKANRALFSQLVTSSGISGVTYNPGGVGTDVQRNQNVQGSLQSTDSSTDLALSGSGFFVTVGDRQLSNNTNYFYTRAGAFREDNRGFLQHPSGTYLLGWRTESDGTVINIQNPEPVELQTVGSSARATSQLQVGLNLNSGEELYNYDITLGAGGMDTIIANLDQVVADPTQAQFITDSRFYDTQGSPRDVSIAFTKRANNVWDYTIFTDGGNVVNGTEGTNEALAYGTLQFNDDGSLQKNDLYDLNGALIAGENLTIDWSGGVEQGNIAIDFGDYTGGIQFGIADLDAAGLGPDDGILNMQIDVTKATAGGVDLNATNDFQVQVNAAGELFIRWDPANASGSGPIDSAAIALPAIITEPVTLEFDNGVTLTLDETFTPPAGPAQVGTDILTGISAERGTGVGTDGVLQFNSPFNTQFSIQDGFGSGTLANLSVTEDGFVVGSFTNGETKRLFKLVVAVFQDPEQLDAVSGNLFRETDGSGRPLYKEAGVGNTATVASGSLEQSTVDIASEFSDMIVSQRAFQASSKIVSTVDQMLNELLNLR